MLGPIVQKVPKQFVWYQWYDWFSVGILLKITILHVNGGAWTLFSLYMDVIFLIEYPLVGHHGIEVAFFSLEKPSIDCKLIFEVE
jgi:hypothetical protein